MTCADVIERLEEYVAGGLTEAERDAIDAHAPTCPTCGPRLRELEEAAAYMRLAVPQVEPSPALRLRVLAAARAVPAPAAAAPRRVRWLRPTLPQLAAAMSGLALLLVIGLGGWVVALREEVAEGRAENARLTSELARQRYAVYDLRGAITLMASPSRVERRLEGGETVPQARGVLAFEPSERRAVLTTSDLPSPPPDRSYQIWGRPRGAQQSISLGLLRFDEAGQGYAVVETPLPLDQFERVGVSDEPAGGSPQPTGRRMLSGPLS